jgi:cell wall-associated NlpC family hydrolase
MLVAAAAPALASASNGTGGAEALSSVAATPTASAPAKAKVVLAPITAPTPNVAYHGPVYVKTAAGAIVPYVPNATTTTVGEISTNGGLAIGTENISGEGKPDLLVPGSRARYVNGLAAAPIGAPAVIQQIIWTGNQIIGLPYIYGGGHASFISPGYDCSGTVSFALHGGKLLNTPEDSTEFESFGSHGPGRWISIFANGGHAYMTVAGLRLDTSSADDPSNQQGPRWRPLRPANEGFVVRHPLGL